ncbi:hypothetical protein T11_18112, partial [Trichinella zimbabwensis]
LPEMEVQRQIENVVRVQQAQDEQLKAVADKVSSGVGKLIFSERSDIAVRISTPAGNDSHWKSETVQWVRCEPKEQSSRRRRSECGAKFCSMFGILNAKQNGSTFLWSLSSVGEAELLSVGSLFYR